MNSITMDMQPLLGSQVSKSVPTSKDQIPKFDENLIDFGRLRKDNEGKFMLVKHNIEKAFINDVRKYLFHKDGFNIPEPKFIISVTGGAKKFTVSDEIIEAFKSALIRVAANTKALIVSGGLDVGVMSVVGDAIKEDLIGAKLPVLGIASWRRAKLQFHDEETNTDSDAKAKFLKELKEKKPELEKSNSDLFARQKENNLEARHSCFIFVDNDHTGMYRGEIKFRSQLEHAIAEHFKIPLICIALEGGIGTLETICHTIENRHPVVLIDNTGGSADLIKELLENNIFIEALLVRNKFKKLLDTQEKKKNAKKYLEAILQHHKEYINIFELKGQENEFDLEEAFLNSIAKAEKYDEIENPNYSLHLMNLISLLAILWDRPDLAQNALRHMQNDKNITDKHYDPLFKLALVENKPKFINLMLKRLKFKEFLTKEMLFNLYNNEMRHSKRPNNEPLSYYLQMNYFIKHNEDIKFAHVAMFLSDCFERLDTVLFLPNDSVDDQTTVDKPVFNLFLWCILSNRIETAKIFWRLGNNQLCNALIASKILNVFAAYLPDDKERFQSLAKEFENLAIKLLDVFEENTRDYVNDVLVIRHLKFIRMDCIQLAIESDCQYFVAHKVIQNALNKIWTGTSNEDFNEKKDLMSSNELKLLKCQQTENDTENYIFRTKAHVFAPRIKFILHVTFYSIFLFLFTLTMLFKIPLLPDHERDLLRINKANESGVNSLKVWPKFIKMESILLIWILAITFGECLQLFCNNYPGYTFKTKLKKYLNERWNTFDVFGSLIFITGYILEFFIVTYQYGRVTLSIDLCIWYIRLLQFFFVSQRFGPKILMIQEMVKDLANFLAIMAVFLLAFGVALQSIMDPYENISFSLLSDILDKAYWPIYGEIPLLDTLLSNTCGQETGKPCLSRLKYASSYILLMVYMVIASVLLVNLLIAVFSGTYNKIQQNSDILWKNQRYVFISEYVDSPFLPPPLNFIAFIIAKTSHMCCKSRASADLGEIDDEIRESIKYFEQNCARKVLIQTSTDINQKIIQELKLTTNLKLENVLKEYAAERERIRSENTPDDARKGLKA